VAQLEHNTHTTIIVSGRWDNSHSQNSDRSWGVEVSSQLLSVNARDRWALRPKRWDDFFYEIGTMNDFQVLLSTVSLRFEGSWFIWFVW